MKPSIDQQILGELFEDKLTKGQLTQQRILIAAIKCYAGQGIDKTTYESIAQAANCTKQLVKKYFSDKDDLFRLAVSYIRAHFQRFVILKIKDKTNPKEILYLYVDSCFEWAKDFPDHTLVWSLFYYHCGTSKKSKDLHNKLVEIGQNRLVNLIKMGVATHQFKANHPELSAKLIQSTITGALTTICTEDLTVDMKLFQKEIVRFCEGILQG